MRTGIKYARSGDLSIAYEVVGDGPLDLVFVPGLVSHLDNWWEQPASSRFMERLASYSRLILFDKRGTGVSDPVAGVPTLEQRMDDVRAVMDAAGSERAALIGLSEGGPMSVLFAATYPQRTIALVLTGASAGWRDEAARAPVRRVLDSINAGRWGQGDTIDVFIPEMADNPRARAAIGHFERTGASPAMARALTEANFQIDVHDILPTIQTPTLVIQRTDDRAVPASLAREMAGAIPGARYIEQPGNDHLPWLGDADGFQDEVEEFLTGARAPRALDRVLATVLFTDIVGSTELASKLGDRRWRALLEEHSAVIRSELERFRGREVKTLGDGFLATFDGPARGVRCARSVADAVRDLGIEIRAGLHTGECELIGGDDVGGVAVHIGARVAAAAGASEVLVSSTVKDLVVGSGLEFADRGGHELKGVAGEWRLYAAVG
jgi:pimeloyl-ACP methyl ester carboxylesterase